MPSFSPPTRSTVPPVEVDTQGLAARLFQRVHPVSRAVNVWKMPNGTYTENQPVYLSNPNPGSSEVDTTQVPVITYLGGETYTVSAAEAAALNAAGYTTF